MLEFAKITDPQDRAALEQIVSRGVDLFHKVGVKRTRMDVEMDVRATHAKIPLRLGGLAQADDFNFGHDIGGIYRHLNRQTGELEDCFVPRFAQSEAA